MKSKRAKGRSSEIALYMPPSLKPIGISLLLGIGVFAVMLMLFALVMSFQDVPIMD